MPTGFFVDKKLDGTNSDIGKMTHLKCKKMAFD